MSILLPVDTVLSVAALTASTQLVTSRSIRGAPYADCLGRAAQWTVCTAENSGLLRNVSQSIWMPVDISSLCVRATDHHHSRRLLPGSRFDQTRQLKKNTVKTCTRKLGSARRNAQWREKRFSIASRNTWIRSESQKVKVSASMTSIRRHTWAEAGQGRSG